MILKLLFLASFSFAASTPDPCRVYQSMLFPVDFDPPKENTMAIEGRKLTLTLVSTEEKGTNRFLSETLKKHGSHIDTIVLVLPRTRPPSDALAELNTTYQQVLAEGDFGEDFQTRGLTPEEIRFEKVNSAFLSQYGMTFFLNFGAFRVTDVTGSLTTPWDKLEIRLRRHIKPR